MEDNLLVEFSEHSELVKVSLTGENPQELADIINAINAAYMKEVVLVDQLKKKSILDTLDRSRGTMEKRVKSRKSRSNWNTRKDAPPATMPAKWRDARNAAGRPVKMKAHIVAVFTHQRSMATVGTWLQDLEQHLKMLKGRRDKIETDVVSNTEVDNDLSKDQEFQILKDKAERAETRFKFMKNSYASPTDPMFLIRSRSSTTPMSPSKHYKRTKKTELVRQVQD